jgi:hypothetical protein
MTLLWWTWAGGAAVLLLVGGWVGTSVRGHWGGVLVDARGRYSLTRIQISLWTVTLLPLITAVLVARSAEVGLDPLGFTLPPEVLALMGVSVASAAGATAVKARKNRTRAPFVAAAPDGAARLVQAVLIEEGPTADETVDITKLQNLIVIVVLVLAYVLITWHSYSGLGPAPVISAPRDITTLPTFDATFVALLAISHAGYHGGKLPDRGQTSLEGTPAYSLSDKGRETAARRQAAAEGTEIPTIRERFRLARERQTRSLEAASRRRADEITPVLPVPARATPAQGRPSGGNDD